MANIIQTAQWLADGKDVRRKCWGEGVRLAGGHDLLGLKLTLPDLLADDWEVYDDRIDVAFAEWWKSNYEKYNESDAWLIFKAAYAWGKFHQKKEFLEPAPDSQYKTYGYDFFKQAESDEYETGDLIFDKDHTQATWAKNATGRWRLYTKRDYPFYELVGRDPHPPAEETIQMRGNATTVIHPMDKAWEQYKADMHYSGNSIDNKRDAQEAFNAAWKAAQKHFTKQ